ncbi:hypothetical protein H0I76_15655 [Limibaculum sp. M0105]|uniref:Uncharacterized protein n=1 Tax=Thermohalobaculum xanthum TaxID=2753746 RepID=A0A8J7M971_9RHOB|nr:hypothetical protein [Thermohalobaculum xanthum]MBK0400634.1 hypothetical protein [Thermohalobaculum xanthum]
MMPHRRMPIDELDWRLRDALSRHRLTGWPLKFAVSFVSLCKRGRSPSSKQIKIAREIVADLRAGTAGPLVEDIEPLLDDEAGP